MFRFSARGAYLLLVPPGGPLFETGLLIGRTLLKCLRKFKTFLIRSAGVILKSRVLVFEV